MAVKLGRALDMTPEYWLNAQLNFQLSQVNQAKVNKIKKLVGNKVA